MAQKTFTGEVMSNKMKNTVVVKMEREIPHARYKRLIKRTSKLLADTNGMEIVVGDIVVIEEIKPMSKKKNFRVIKKEVEVKK